MLNQKIVLKDRKTFVFIDVSNIRYACRRSCNFDLDFIKYYHYLQNKYVNLQAKHASFKCPKCGTLNTLQVLPKTTKLKSNVDVYMAVDMLKCAVQTTEPIHIILVSCDGDFAEAIHGVLSVNPNVFVTIMATPMTKTNNCLSVRLKNLRNELPNNMTLMNIDNLREQISQ